MKPTIFFAVQSHHFFVIYVFKICLMKAILWGDHLVYPCVIKKIGSRWFQCLPIQLFDPLAILHIAIFHITICKRWFIYKWVIAWYSYVKLRDGKCKLRTPATKGFVFSYLFVTHPFSFLCLSQRGCEPKKSGEKSTTVMTISIRIWEFESWHAGFF